MRNLKLVIKNLWCPLKASLDITKNYGYFLRIKFSNRRTYEHGSYQSNRWSPEHQGL
jgi:hypothetical protein